MIKVFPVDRYSYLEYTILLDERMLTRLGLCTLYCTSTRKHNHVNAYQVFGAAVREFLFIHGVYANINTTYFFGTSDICFNLIFDALFFLCFVKNLQIC